MTLLYSDQQRISRGTAFHSDASQTGRRGTSAVHSSTKPYAQN